MTKPISKNITIQTITPVYDKMEDRIRLSINYQDIQSRIDLMITRSFILELIPSMEEYVDKYYPNIYTEGKKEIDSSSDQEKNIQNDTPLFETSAEDLELYKGREDLLYTLNLSYDNVTQKTTLQLISKNKFNANLVLDVTLFQHIIQSIKNSIPQIAWGISKYF